jgi:hypothetical protein
MIEIMKEAMTRTTVAITTTSSEATSPTTPAATAPKTRGSTMVVDNMKIGNLPL